jgi:hypothetical protein
LNFWINVRAEETQIQDGIWFSNNGGQTFIKVYGFNFDNNIDYDYYPIELDVSALASSNNVPFSDQFVVRFQQHDDSDFSGQPDGYVLDDIMLSGTVSTFSVPSLNSLKIYPNPVGDVLWVSGLLPQTTQFMVHNAQGKMVHAGTMDGDLKLEMGQLPAGVYFLECRQENEIWQSRFVKQ